MNELICSRAAVWHGEDAGLLALDPSTHAELAAQRSIQTTVGSQISLQTSVVGRNPQNFCAWGETSDLPTPFVYLSDHRVITAERALKPMSNAKRPR
jgi:hypothetical protein